MTQVGELNVVVSAEVNKAISNMKKFQATMLETGKIVKELGNLTTGLQDITVKIKELTEESKKYEEIQKKVVDNTEHLSKSAKEVNKVQKTTVDTGRTIEKVADNNVGVLGKLNSAYKNHSKYISGFLTKWKMGWFGVMFASITGMYALMKASSFLRMWFSELTGILQVFTDSALEPIAPAMEKTLDKGWAFTDWFSKLPPIIRGATGAFLMLGGLDLLTGRHGFKFLWKGAKKAFNKLKPILEGGKRILSSWIRAFLDKHPNIETWFKKWVLDPIGKVKTKISEKVKNIFKPITDIVEDLRKKGIGKTIEEWSKKIEDSLREHGFWKTLGKGVKKIYKIGSKIADAFITVYKNIKETVGEPFVKIGSKMKKGISKGLEKIGVHKVKLPKLPHIESIDKFISKYSGQIEKIKGLGSKFKGVFSKVSKVIMKIPIFKQLGKIFEKGSKELIRITKGGIFNTIGDAIFGEISVGFDLGLTGKWILEKTGLMGAIANAGKWVKKHKIPPGLWATIVEPIGTISETVVSVAQLLSDAFGTIIDVILNFVITFGKVILDIAHLDFSGAWSHIKEFFTSTKSTVSKFGGEVKDKISEIIGNWETTLSNVFSNVSFYAGKIYNKLKTWIWDDVIKKVFDDVTTEMSKWPIIGTIVSTLTGLGGRLWGAFTTELGEAEDKLISWAKGELGLSPTLTEIAGMIPTTLINGLKGAGTTIWNGIKNEFHSIIDSIEKWVGDFTDIPTDIINTIVNSFTGAGTTIWEGIKGEFHSVSKKAEDWAKGILGLSPTLTEIGKMIPKTISEASSSEPVDIHDTIKTSLPKIENETPDIKLPDLSPLFEDIKKYITGKTNDLYEILKEFYWNNGIKKVWNFIADNIQGKVADFVSIVLSYFKESSKRIYEVLEQSFWYNTFKKIFDYIVRESETFPDNIVTAIINSFKGAGTRIWDGIKSEFHLLSNRMQDWSSGVIGLSPTLSEIGAMIPKTISQSASSVPIDIHKTIKTILPEKPSELSTRNYTTATTNNQKVINITFNPTINIKTDYTTNQSSTDIRDLADKLSEYWKDDITRIVRGAI